MRLLSSVILSCGLTAVLFCTAAHAADCKPLQIVNTVKMERAHDGTRFLVPVEINGTAQKLILDTGGAITQLSPQLVKTLGLKEEVSRFKLYDFYGNSSDSQVTIKTFDLGRARGEGLRFQVSPMQNLETEAGANGLLSTDLFLQYDVDMDFGADRLNYFSQDHCEGQVTYWPERPVAAVPITLEKSHINVPATIDGHQVRAIIDTGADNSAMTVAVAISTFGIKPGSEDAPLVETSASDPLLKAYSHKFETLSFEGIAVTNPKISIISDRVGAKDLKPTIRGQTSDPYGSHIQEVIIGMDVLRHLHLYIAYKEKKLYISPAGTGESVLFKAAAAPAN
jgi:predicted aspartyl protease